jgi:hypothetical protein
MKREPENAFQIVGSRSSLGGRSRSAAGRGIGRFSLLLGGSASTRAAGRFLRRNLWVWPIIAAALLGGAGWWVNRSVEDAMRQQRVTNLNTILKASVDAIRVWMGQQRINVQLFTEDEQLRPMVRELLSLEDPAPGSQRRLVQAQAQADLRSRLAARLRLSGYVGFVLVSPKGEIIAADQDAAVGKPLTGARKEPYDRAMAGETMVCRPFRSSLLLTDENGELRANLPTMFVSGPIRDEAGKAVAALGLRIRPEDQFTRILQVARFGESGETYAFDRTGLLLSQSRFDDALKDIGLLVDQPDSQSILTLEIRDPGVNLADGERPKIRRANQPLTRMAADAVQGINGNDADGYRDYRGVPTVGAWEWLPDYEFGVATEVDTAEAFHPVYILRRTFRVLMVLLIAAAVGIFLAMLIIARQQRALQKATLAAKQLGQYALEEKLGAGGMGTVYKARHAMLRRPTAVKLLDVDKMSRSAIARFEREVQLTSALTHPNTVAVFDYGRTPEGIFYYAMEYLDGLNLDDLVTRFGPIPEARVVYLLRQVCGSLAEAHASGLVHRDVKPANIFLTRRGGMYDFVKVLDFGLVKAVASEENANFTNPNAVTGTPLYLSPEAINHPEQVDARTDVYAIGAVGYFLLTANPVFSGRTIMEICMKHVKEAPEPPSARGGRPVSPDLEALLLSCLAKERASRPADATGLLHALEACIVQGMWTAADAAAWWAAKERAVGPFEAGAGDAIRSSMPSPGPETTMAYGDLNTDK